jgi:hypothetical protein
MSTPTTATAARIGRIATLSDDDEPPGAGVAAGPDEAAGEAGPLALGDGTAVAALGA